MRCRYSRFEQVREALARRKDSVGFAEKAFGPDSLAKCEAEYQLALSEFDSGHLDEAVLGFSSALRLHSKLPQQDSYLLANILLGLGNVQHARSYWSQALECYSQAMHVLRESREKDAEAGPMTSRRQTALASILVNIALVHMERGDMVFANASCDTDTHTLRCKLGQTDRCCNFSKRRCQPSASFAELQNIVRVRVEALTAIRWWLTCGIICRRVSMPAVR